MNEMQQWKPPFRLGREAYNNGKPMTDNPYRPGSNEHMDWDAGWQYEDDKDMGEKHQ